MCPLGVPRGFFHSVKGVLQVGICWSLVWYLAKWLCVGFLFLLVASIVERKEVNK